MAELDTSLSGSQDKSAETLRRVTDLFLANSGQYTEQQIALFEDVFARLVSRIESRALAELSHCLAPVPDAPPGLMQRLAGDDTIAVAAPVLAQSPVLTEAGLASLAASKSQEHLRAIAGRASVPPAVSDVLIERGDREVVRSLAANPGAEMSEGGYTRLIDRTVSDEELTELVAARNDISLPGLNRLLSRATKDVCARLLPRVKPDFAQHVHETLLRIFDRIDNDLQRQRSTALAEVETLRAAGRLDAKAALDFATGQKLAQLTGALALLGNTSFELIADIMDSGQNYALMVACKAAGLPWSTSFALLKSRPGQRDIVEFQFDRLLHDFCRLSSKSAQRVLQFWQIRKPGDKEGERQHKKRASPRSRIHQAAIILCANNTEKACTMIDISRGGAKLQIAGSGDLPDRFVITLARNRLVRRNCRVVWRSSKSGLAQRSFGVCFE